MKSFDDWFENEMPNSHKKVGKEKIETVIYSCAESAWNHKQAEVDELRKRIDATNCKIDFWLDNPNGTAAYVALDIKNILKGESHE